MGRVRARPTLFWIIQLVTVTGCEASGFSGVNDPHDQVDGGHGNEPAEKGAGYKADADQGGVNIQILSQTCAHAAEIRPSRVR